MGPDVPNNLFIEKLEEQLKLLPSWKEQKVREDSWMTASQIAKWYKDAGYGQYPEEIIEQYLVNKWEKNELMNIRPAKYPHSENLCTLWGHTERVYPQTNKIRVRKIDPRKYYSQKNLSVDAPLIFISHSIKDFKYAKKISKEINEIYGYKTWLCEEKLNIYDKINEEVRKSILQCDAVVVALTFLSIGSAYIDSELKFSTMSGKKIIAIINSDDADFMAVIETYEKAPYSSDLSPLLKKYELIEKDEHRRGRYKKNAQTILSYLSGNKTEIVLYPYLSQRYINIQIQKLENALEYLKKK